MGREVRRVPLDFDWPIGEVWSGYLMPDRLREVDCPADDDCVNGQTRAGAWVMQMANLCLMVDDDLNAQARGQAMHPYLNDTGSYAYRVRPSEDIREFGTGLAGRGGGGFGHDSIDTWNATAALIRAAGLPETWGRCLRCDGHASVEAYPGQRVEAEAWEPTDPPEGEGWQLWSTTSEGEPMTPVFATPEALAEHCAAAGVSVFGSHRADRAGWLKIITGEDFAHIEVAPGVVMM